MLWSVLLTTYLASPVNIAQGTLCKAESTKPFSHMHNEQEQKTDKRAVQTPLIAVFRFKICEKKLNKLNQRSCFVAGNDICADCF